MQRLLDKVVRGTKTVMTRVELGGTLFAVAVVGVFLTSREEGDKSSQRSAHRDASFKPNPHMG